MGTEEIKKEIVDMPNWYAQLSYDQWVPIPVAGQRPSARYKVSRSSVKNLLAIIMLMFSILTLRF